MFVWTACKSPNTLKHFIVEGQLNRTLFLLGVRGHFQHKDILSRYGVFHYKDGMGFSIIKIIKVQDHAPVPLSIFRSNSKLMKILKHSGVKHTRPITTIFCTRHDSVTVVTCAKYRCDRSSTFETRAFWIFIEFRCHFPISFICYLTHCGLVMTCGSRDLGQHWRR